MTLSAYLSADFDPSAPVAVVAGNRDYPRLAVAAMRAAGVPVKLIALEGETEDALWADFAEPERAKIKVGQVGKLLKSLTRLKARYALFVGSVTPGKLFKGLHPDLKAIAILATLKQRNAETIFGAIAQEITDIGVTMLDARAFMDDHLATVGEMVAGKATPEPDNLAYGIEMAREIARLDIGQGVVVRKGTVLAVEAFEGTDDMLARANKYKTDRLIFVKTAKPNQNPHFDWPCFGVKTLEAMHASGVGTAALEAGRVVMLDKPAILAKAKALGIRLEGF